MRMRKWLGWIPAIQPFQNILQIKTMRVFMHRMFLHALQIIRYFHQMFSTDLRLSLNFSLLKFFAIDQHGFDLCFG